METKSKRTPGPCPCGTGSGQHTHNDVEGISAGPWVRINRLDERGTPCGINIENEDNIICRPPDGATVTGIKTYPHQSANARLIAAAPELLDACRRAGDTLAWLERKYGNLAPDAGITESLDDIRSAINRATGR